MSMCRCGIGAWCKFSKFNTWPHYHRCMTSDEMFKELFNSIDEMDSEKFVSFVDPEGVFIFGSWPPVVGREGIKGDVDQFFGTIKGLKHTLIKTWQVGDDVIVHGSVTYTRMDDKEVTLQFMNLFEMNGQLIKRYQIFIDVGPLYAE